jgi:hypothetical protein
VRGRRSGAFGQGREARRIITAMNEDDLTLRNLTYARFVELGRAPTAAEVAVAAGRDLPEA